MQQLISELMKMSELMQISEFMKINEWMQISELMIMSESTDDIRMNQLMIFEWINWRYSNESTDCIRMNARVYNVIDVCTPVLHTITPRISQAGPGPR